jgi:cell filamentation protein
MASKYLLESNTIYLEGTDIPHNKLGITNTHELERELLEEAYQVFYQELTDDTQFDEDYFKALHRRTFEGLYERARDYRQFNMSKGTSRFCQGAYVASSSHKIFTELEKVDYLKKFDGSTVEFAQQLAHFKGELIALHPFCELNGRITRLFFDMIALSNDYSYIDYSGIKPEAYINASIDCVQLADSSPMALIIAGGLKANLT